MQRISALRARLGLALVLVAAGGCATGAAAARAATPKDPQGYEERWGIEPLGVRVTAAGYMLDFRVKVRDRARAAPLLVRSAKAHLVVEKSGGVLQVARSPKIGALRATVRTESMLKEDRVYATLFANPGRLVQPGDRVTIVMGDLRAEHLVVQ